MAKKKNKKVSSDKIQFKSRINKNVNKLKSPFEIHINNEKMKVLGRKDKNKKGMPAVSRAKALAKRKKTLLQEYKYQNKSNMFSDKRIGESNTNMSSEQKQMARFAAVRVKSMKKSIYNLDDNEILTHRGQTLSEIEKFDDPRSEDESDEESGKLDREFVEEAHFGGGLLQKTHKDGAKTHKTLIEELIAESKKRKAEKQRTKEATMELTEKLDTEWKDLQPLVAKNKKDNKDNDKYKNTQTLDDYDKVMGELKFEARGTVSDKLKSEEQLAQEEKSKLELLESERLERMKGEPSETTVFNHRSADDLDDNFVYEENEPITISYGEDGKCRAIIDNQKIHQDNNEQEENEEEEEGSDESEDVETESEDDLSDLKDESEDETENMLNEDHEMSTEKVEIHSEKEEVSMEKIVMDTEDVETSNEEEEEMNLKHNEKDTEDSKVPFTFKLPNSYEELKETLGKYETPQQGIVLDRMIKCNHSSLAQGNKENLGVLFAYLMQFMNDIAVELSITECFDSFKMLMPRIFELAQLNPEFCHKSVVEVIKEKYKDYLKTPKVFPSLECLLYLKMVDVLFTTSDFRHQIVTPCLVFLEQMLTRCKVNSRKGIAYGVFLATIVLEYTSLSKRYMPGCINFLRGILHMAVPKSVLRVVKVLPLFQKETSLLVLNTKLMTLDSLNMDISDLTTEKIDDSFKVRTINTVMKLINEFYINLKDVQCNLEIFEPIYHYCNLINVELYPSNVGKLISDFIEQYESDKKKKVLTYVMMEAKKPKALRMYEPKIEVVYDGKRHKVQSKEKAERDKLLHKLKRERKGALREIRRDNAFISSIKIAQAIRSDAERKEKVKRILAEANVQQSELNAIDRKNKKK